MAVSERMPVIASARRFDGAAVALPAATTILLFLIAEILKKGGLLPAFIPAPSELVAELVHDPSLVTRNLWPTISTAFLGYLAAAIITLLAGALTSSAGILRRPIYNLGITLNAIPIIATTPLLALLLGTGTSLQIVIAALASQFPMLVSTMQGLDAADARQKELFHSLSASSWQSFRLLRLPSALPYLFTGLKIAAPSAVLGTITAEWAGADRGVGAMMLYALFSYDVVKVWISVALTCALAAGAYGFWAFVETRVVFWGSSVETE